MTFAPKRNSFRSHRTTEPEVWLRIKHLTLESHGDAPDAVYCELTVDIAPGSRGVFENGNIGTLSRRVPADRVVSAFPLPRGKPKPPLWDPGRPGL